jgi:hypothetical protein
MNVSPHVDDKNYVPQACLISVSGSLNVADRLGHIKKKAGVCLVPASIAVWIMLLMDLIINNFANGRQSPDCHSSGGSCKATEN